MGLVILGPVLPHAHADTVHIIANLPESESRLSPSQLRRIFTMRQRQWPDGTLIQVFVLPNNDPLHQHFAKSQLQLYPYQLERVWNKLVYTGMGERPVEVYSEAQMRARVAATPGAIGYISGAEQAVEDFVYVSIEEGNP